MTWALAVILLLFVALGTVYSLVVPPFEASDELWHYPMVQTIAENGALPVQDPANVGPWRQEGSQPPLYYALMALATGWIDTSDMAEVRHLNPHVDNGVATPDGNINLVVHNPEREVFPWRGTVLAVHLIRFLSVLMGAGSVYLTYRIVGELFPDAPLLALAAAAIHAFTPMFVFVSASVNNDNLVILLSNLVLLLLIKLAQPAHLQTCKPANLQTCKPANLQTCKPANLQTCKPANLQTCKLAYLPLGILLGLAILTKTSSLALTLLTALVVIVRALRGRSWREFLWGSLGTLLPVLAISGWWFLRNLRLYGDLTGFSAFFAILGTRDVPADLAQLWRERSSFLAGYWGNFGGLNVPMPPWVYTALNTILLLAALGLLLTLLKTLATCKLAHLHTCTLANLQTCKPANLHTCTLANLHTCTLAYLWALGVLIPWLGWARITWSSQGRLVFPAIAVWSLLLAQGLAAWLPRRWGHWLALAFAAFLLILAAVAPFAWIRPAYALPEPLSEAQVAAIPHPLDVNMGGVMRLIGFELQAEAVEAGGSVPLTLYWEALSPSERDLSVFVHLLGEGERLVAQRDTFPALGRLSATWLEPGFRWADHVVLQLPATAYAPDVTQIEIGLYDPVTGQRLPLSGPDGASLGDNVRLDGPAIRPRAGAFPNPLAVDWGGQMELVGYDLSQRVVARGEAITLTLYWRGQRPMATNYTVSAQLVDPAQNKAAQHDGWPQDGAAPTAGWQPGQVITDTHVLAVFADAAPGVYDLRLAVYTLTDDGAIAHLPVVPRDGRMLADHLILTPVRVLP